MPVNSLYHPAKFPLYSFKDALRRPVKTAPFLDAKVWAFVLGTDQLRVLCRAGLPLPVLITAERPTWCDPLCTVHSQAKVTFSRQIPANRLALHRILSAFPSPSHYSIPKLEGASCCGLLSAKCDSVAVWGMPGWGPAAIPHPSRLSRLMDRMAGFFLKLCT